MGQVVLVTGVSRYVGGRYARMLTEHPAVDRVIGVDVVPPPHPIGGAEFVRADIRNPIIAKVIAQAEVDTVAHLNVIATPLSAGGRVTMKEIAENDYNLNISRYVSTAEAEEEIDLAAVHAELVRIEEEIGKATRTHNAFLRELGLAPLPLAGSKSKAIR